MIDLHIHSTASDGTCTPEELVKLAVTLGLKAIAIADHDSVDGIQPAIDEASKQGIEVIPAIELSSDLEGRDIHILGYFIDYKHPWFEHHLEDLRKARYERALKMVKRLQEVGLDILVKDVLKHTADGTAVGRAHLAQAMREKGYVDNIQEAFDRYIGKDGPCYVEKNIYSPLEVIKIIKQVNGIPVLAHPGISKVDEFIPDFINAGLQGLEAYHSRHNRTQTLKYKRLAKKLGLIVTGGSDFHGLSMGLLIGSVNVPDSIVDDLKRLKQSAT